MNERNYIDQVIEYTIPILEKLNIRHEIHRFDSGAIMIDIWVAEKFYCVQLFENFIGLSLVTEDSGFNTIPDISYESMSLFKIDFEKLIKLSNN